MDEKLPAFELCVDYLFASRCQVRAVGLREILGEVMGHDHITRILSKPELEQKLVKPLVRQIEQDVGCIVVDDFFVEKPHSTPNSNITVNWDHARQQYVLSINVLNFLYTVGQGSAAINLPIA